MNLDLNIDGPRDPDYVLEVAEAFAEAARVMNHLTRDHGALQYPSEADRLIRDVSLAVSRLPQLLEQVAGWLEAEQAAGRITMASGSPYLSSSFAAEVARMKLEQAQAHARILQQALDAAASVTSDMAGVDGSEDEDADG